MRIQHNIAAMNSYRNYSANNKAVSKNLEKLSSGYRINRAGDDAAGLAISEKMRAQITGLKTAQKNAKDGVSLIQTAEGALTEVHSMLNRMVELADQSANGTFDDTTDRANLQKEISQLTSEIDRISDSTNFNGIKLLDGSLAAGGTGGKGSISNDAGQALVAGAGTMTDVAAVKGEYEYKFANDTGVVKSGGGRLAFEFELSDGSKKTVNVDLAGAATASGVKTAIANALGSDAELGRFFDVTVSGSNTATSALSLKFTAKEGGTDTPSVKNIKMTEQKVNGTGGFTDGADGSVLTKGLGLSAAPVSVGTKVSAADAYTQINFGDTSGASAVTNADLMNKSVTIGNKTYTFTDGKGLYDSKEGETAVVLGKDRTETMQNLAAALKKDGVTTASADGANIKIGNTDEIKSTKGYGLETTSTAGVKFGGAVDIDGVYKFSTSAAGTNGTSYNLDLNYTDKDGKTQTAKISYVAGATQSATNQAIIDAINNNKTLKGIFSASAGSGANEIDLTAAGNSKGAILNSTAGLAGSPIGTGAAVTNPTKAFAAGQTIDLDPTKLQKGDTVTIDGKTYEFTTAADLADVKDGNTAVIFDPTGSKNSVANNLAAAMKSNGVASKVDSNNNVLIEYDGANQGNGKGGLTLQIGDTSDDFNQLTVFVGDMHAKNLGIGDINIATQDGGKAAIDKLKAAINSVSSTRGDLGAAQNRLDHTMNNLSVMQENIQDAESSIRDVDVADEMMAYTKNNILVQSAQAMLAQANQLPQGVLQLLG